MHVPEMFTDVYAPLTLMEVAASVPNIICIAQITLLVDQRRFFFCDSQMIKDFYQSFLKQVR